MILALGIAFFVIVAAYPDEMRDLLVDAVVPALENRYDSTIVPVTKTNNNYLYHSKNRFSGVVDAIQLEVSIASVVLLFPDTHEGNNALSSKLPLSYITNFLFSSRVVVQTTTWIMEQDRKDIL